jgi:RNA polymerase sigma-70 factor, ECF subfamily
MTKNNHAFVSNGLSALLPRLWRFAYTLSHSPDIAEDLVQAACVRALERAEQFQQGTNLDRWVFTILSSIWKNQLRANAIRQGQGHVPAEDVLTIDGRRMADANIELQQVLKQIQGLPEAQRVTVLLVYVEGQSYRDAAEVLEIPIGTVMSRLAAARASLGRLQKDMSDDGSPLGNG